MVRRYRRDCVEPLDGSVVDFDEVMDSLSPKQRKAILDIIEPEEAVTTEEALKPFRSEFVKGFKRGITFGLYGRKKGCRLQSES